MSRARPCLRPRPASRKARRAAVWRSAALLAAVSLFAFAVAGLGPSSHAQAHGSQRRDALSSAIDNLRRGGIHKIKHIVIIMQENRSFDSYFGTYPGAKGIPGLAGNRGRVPCLPDPHEHCVKPFHDRYDRNLGGPNSLSAARQDINGGKMNGFVSQAEGWYRRCRCRSAVPPDDEMGYHTGKEIPNYWTYAHDFVLQDHMFASVASWSLPTHLYTVSGWSAFCKTHKPASCRNEPQYPGYPPGWPPSHPAKKPPIYAWTDLTYLLSKHHVSWRYYFFNGTEPTCDSDRSKLCMPSTNGPQSLTIWNPLKYFETVHHDRQTKNIQSVKHFFSDAKKDKLPAVSWVVPSITTSEHPPNLVSAGQTYVTGLINTVMRSRDWGSTAIFLVWDDWSGFYDNLVPPTVDENGYGLRVPGLVISPYAKKGYIDHQTLSFDAYLKFIEDDFLKGDRLNPKTDGRPDPRPTVREDVRKLGNLVKDFNFRQKPRKPIVLPVHPKTDLKPGGLFFGWSSVTGNLG
jgi:phospholipase C